MKSIGPFDNELEIFASGKNIQLRSKTPIPCCWIKVSDPAGKIVFKKIEKQFTDITIPLNVKDGFYHVTLVTEKSIATKMVFLE
jgi:hypothetical protein